MGVVRRGISQSLGEVANVPHDMLDLFPTLGQSEVAAYVGRNGPEDQTRRNAVCQTRLSHLMGSLCRRSTRRSTAKLKKL